MPIASSLSRREPGRPPTRSAIFRSARTGLNPALSPGNGETGSESGINVTSSCTAEDEPKPHVLGAAAGTDASFQVKVGTNVFLNCKTGLVGDVGWRTSLFLNPSIRQVGIEGLEGNGHGGQAFLLS